MKSIFRTPRCLGPAFLLLAAVVGNVNYQAMADEPAAVPVQDILEARLSQDQLQSGQIRLFDGVTLMGWELSDLGNWSLEEGSLVGKKENGSSSAQGAVTDRIVTTVPFFDYKLSFECRLSDGAAGQCLVDVSESRSEQGADVLRIPLESIRGAVEPSQKENWFEVDVRVSDSVDYKDRSSSEIKLAVRSARRGRIGFEISQGMVEIRNVTLTPVVQKLIPGNRDAFEAGVKLDAKWNDDGTLTLVGGRGYVETKDQLGDGVIQFAATTLTENVNSGLFFRCIPGEDMNGYECQLHHGFDGERTKALDAGTGAIFRRQNARVVLSDEGQTTYVTIVVAGPRMATWVQGVQVVDWEDTRKADPNPRRGLRLEPGTIMLQGHDPESRVRFEQLSIGKSD